MSDFPSDKWAGVNGLQFHYRNWGGAGQQVVLLHGLASTSHIWDLVAPLLTKDFSVVALDQRGHGESDKPDEGYDFDTVVSDLLGFVEHLEIENPIVIGHSWGGDVALEFGVKHPELARGLGFVDGGTIDISSRPDNTLEKAKVDMAPPVWTGMTFERLRERARSRRIESMMTPAHEEILLANFHEVEGKTITARLSRENHMRIIEALWDHKPFELYPMLKCPVLLMPARQQDDAAQMARRQNRESSIARASELIPLSKTVWFEDSIHDVPIQRPELVASVINEHITNGFFEKE